MSFDLNHHCARIFRFSILSKKKKKSIGMRPTFTISDRCHARGFVVDLRLYLYILSVRVLINRMFGKPI